MFLPKHLSYSSLNTYEQCPRSYFLGKVKEAEERQTWFFPVGTAVHTLIDEHLRTGDTFSSDYMDSVFHDLVRKQMAIDPNVNGWLHGGSDDDPVWKDKAMQMVKDCVHKAYEFLEDITIYEYEYDATGMLPGCEVPIKAYIDIVGEHKKHGPVILDWKSSASKPKTALQLEIYAALLNYTDHPFNEHTAIQFNTGLWAMLRPSASKARPIDLSGVDPVALGARFQKMYDSIKQKLWQTKHGYGCKFCIQAPNCLLESGPTARAKYYDTADSDGFPF